jgi:colanic acid/amylovoran biosynthesis glycosyltransferase
VGEVVEVGSTGFLSAVGDWAGLGDAVLQVLENPTLRNQMSLAARQRAEQKFDLNLTTSLLAQGFHSLLSCPPSSSSLKTPFSLPAGIKRSGDLRH